MKFVRHILMVVLFAGVVFVFFLVTSSVQAAPTVSTEFSDYETFSTIPNLSGSDLAEGKTTERDFSGGNFDAALTTDGAYGTGYANNAANSAGWKHYRIDLGTAYNIAQVNSYSYGEAGATRAKQTFNLYGSTEIAPDWNEAGADWTLIAGVDTSGDASGKLRGGSSISDINTSYRWILWHADDIGFQDTVYKEFDVILNPPIQLISLGVSNVTATSAVAYATLAVDGDTEADVKFYWEQTETDPGETHSGWEGTNSFVSISEGLISSTTFSGLTPDKPYYYRFYATNATQKVATWCIGRFGTKGPKQTVTLTGSINLDNGPVMTTKNAVDTSYYYTNTYNSNPYEYNIDNYPAWKEQNYLWNLNMGSHNFTNTGDNGDDIIINAASISYETGGGNFDFSGTGDRPDLTLYAETSIDVGDVSCNNTEDNDSKDGKLTITAGKSITMASLDADDLGDISFDAGGDITIVGALQNWVIDGQTVKAGFVSLTGNIYYDDAIMPNVTNGFSGVYDILYENDSDSNYDLRPLSKGLILMLL